MSAPSLALPLAAREPVSAPVLREIFYPTDLSPESSPAFDHARVLAHRFATRVTLYHALAQPDPEYSRGRFAQTLAAYRAEEVVVAREKLRQSAESLPRESEIAVETVISPARALIGWIRAHRPDLVVMATHGRGGLSHLLLGSVTEQVIQHARRPVLCVRHAADHGRLPYRRLLVPTDLSPASRAAFPYAAALARAFAAQVLVLYVASPAAESAPISEPSLWYSVRESFAGLEMAVRTDQGRAWERIVGQADSEGADLVVMACQGGDSVDERLLGSNAERVVRHAPCPVLVV
jgi:nucleotide-binding universal stress UspA family protein